MTETIQHVGQVRVALGEHWISLDYGKEISIQSFKIHWERTNATKYRLEKSSDGTNWESVVSFEKKPDSYQQIINLDEPINTQHVRLFIEEFDPKGAPENGNEVTWDTVGIYEFETYAGKLEEPGKHPGSTGNCRQSGNP